MQFAQVKARWPLLGILGAIATLVLVLAACGSESLTLDGDTNGSAGPAVDEAAPPVEEYSGAQREREADGSVSGEVASGGGALPAAPELQSVLDRKIIQSSSVDIEVKEVAREFQEIIRIAETAGGFIASSSFSNVDDEQVADVTIRVPGDQYQGVLAQIRGMGSVTTESSDANDVTEEYTDLQARLRTLEATERRYLELLGQAGTINDILLVQDRLDGVRGQIEQVQGRINLLEHLTDLAAITIHLRPEAAAAAPPDGGGLNPLEAAASAWDYSLDALRAVAAVALVVVVFSWWIVPPLAALGIAARWWVNRRPRPASEAPA